MRICKPVSIYPKIMFRFRALLLFSVAAVMLFGCGGDEESGGGRRSGGNRMGGNGAAQQTAAIPVQVAEVRRGDISMYLLQTTTIEPIRQVDILAKVSGQVVKLLTEEGEVIKKGQLLAKMDEAELEIDYMQTKVQAETNKSIYERSKKMLEEDLIAEETYETARLQYESSKAAAEAAKLRLDYTEIRSPIDGVVTLRSIELGQRINVNDIMFQIADFNPLRARIYVPEKDMSSIFVGQKARISVESEPDKTYP
jgi:RND family efflux transporter MFP subunit